MKYTVGDKVLSAEHPKATGTVIAELSDGLTIEFVTPRSAALPYGHIITEFWPVADIEQLILATEQGQ